MANKNHITQTTNRAKEQFLCMTNLPKDDMKEVHIFKALTLPSSNTNLNAFQERDGRKKISVMIVNQNPNTSEQ